MRSRIYYWRRLVWDYLRYGALPGRIASRLLAVFASLRKNSIQRLALLTRAARVEPTPRRLSRLMPAMAGCLAQLDADGLDWNATGVAARNDMGKGLIVKPPVSPREKGVL